jgi:hypothetical protein
MSYEMFQKASAEPSKWICSYSDVKNHIWARLNRDTVDRIYKTADEALADFANDRLIVEQDAPPEWYYALGI